MLKETFYPLLFFNLYTMKNSLLLFVSVLFVTILNAQELKKDKEYKVLCVSFYNLENLFDTIVDPDPNKILQDDFTPNGAHQFTAKRYQEKLENMAKVIADLGVETTPDGPAILGVAEIENRQVLEDLVAMPAIKDRNYKIVHYDSPDARGIDVALLYQEKYFNFESSQKFVLLDPEDPNHHTRDQLLVSGTIDGEKFHFMVAHWPSRRGGERASRPGRVRAAELGLKVMDSLRAEDASAKIIYMGDLNDDPTSYSLKKVFKSKPQVKSIQSGDLFNAFETHYKQGIGTLAWRDSWNLFDQLILSDALIEKGNNFDSYKYFKSKVFNAPYLKNPEGSFAGYPLRTYVGTNWQGGYSDHFPVYIYLIKEK